MIGINTELQTAYFQALQGITFNGVSVPVYDFVPADAVYPYIRIGEFTQVDNSDKSDYGSEITVQIQVVDRFGASGGSRVPINEIANQVKQIVRPNPFSLDNHNVVTCLLDNETSFRELTDTFFYVYLDMRFRHQTVNAT